MCDLVSWHRDPSNQRTLGVPHPQPSVLGGGGDGGGAARAARVGACGAALHGARRVDVQRSVRCGALLHGARGVDASSASNTGGIQAAQL